MLTYVYSWLVKYLQGVNWDQKNVLSLQGVGQIFFKPVFEIEEGQLYACGAGYAKPRPKAFVSKREKVTVTGTGLEMFTGSFR
ncbi:MAG TPA: hypothetical protein PKE06_14670 [Flavilitoribacter sp.]|nr:hypothetical protein [Flavilitoribacter sp.]HMQ87091.1 hypothetical protein [Flavilitoribacter sp.]